MAPPRTRVRSHILECERWATQRMELCDCRATNKSTDGVIMTGGLLFAIIRMATSICGVCVWWLPLRRTALDCNHNNFLDCRSKNSQKFCCNAILSVMVSGDFCRNWIKVVLGANAWHYGQHETDRGCFFHRCRCMLLLFRCINAYNLRAENENWNAFNGQVYIAQRFSAATHSHVILCSFSMCNVHNVQYVCVCNARARKRNDNSHLMVVRSLERLRRFLAVLNLRFVKFVVSREKITNSYARVFCFCTRIPSNIHYDFSGVVALIHIWPYSCLRSTLIIVFSSMLRIDYTKYMYRTFIVSILVDYYRLNRSDHLICSLQLLSHDQIDIIV